MALPISKNVRMPPTKHIFQDLILYNLRTYENSNTKNISV